jgi:hypothetical protein
MSSEKVPDVAIIFLLSPIPWLTEHGGVIGVEGLRLGPGLGALPHPLKGHLHAKLAGLFWRVRGYMAARDVGAKASSHELAPKLFSKLGG